MEKLLTILEEIKPGFVFEGRTDLVDSGDLDSFDVIALLNELYDAFDITVPMEKVGADDLNSVEAMWALVNRGKKD